MCRPRVGSLALTPTLQTHGWFPRHNLQRILLGNTANCLAVNFHMTILSVPLCYGILWWNHRVIHFRAVLVTIHAQTKKQNTSAKKRRIKGNEMVRRGLDLENSGLPRPLAIHGTAGSVLNVNRSNVIVLQNRGEHIVTCVCCCSFLFQLHAHEFSPRNMGSSR